MRRILWAVLLLVPMAARGASEVQTPEGNSGFTTVTVRIASSSPVPNGFSGTWRTADGTATTADNDYVFATGDWFIPPGQTESNPIAIQVVGDTKVEANETFAVELINPPAGAGIDPGPYPIRIVNDDVAGLTVGSPSVVEGNSSTTTLSFFVTLNALAATTVTASYATSDITATAPSDYVSATGTLSFAPGELTKIVNVTVNGDTLFETNETMRLTVTPTGGAAASGTGTIVNDDVPTVLISPVQAAEGNSGTTPMVFIAMLSAPAPQTIQLSYATSDGTAKAGEDYQPANATLTFPQGESRASITILVNGDTTFEPDETFTLTITGAAGTVTATGLILNDDAVPITTIRIVSGNGQRGRLGTALPQPLVVEVLNANGAPAPGVQVRFSVITGQADLAPSTQTTNAQGRAQTTVTLQSAGTVEVEAVVTGVGRVVFTLASETLFEQRAAGPVAKPIGRALDQLCANNDQLFAAVCRALAQLDDGALTPALERVAPQHSGAQSKVIGEIVGSVSRGIGSRLAARRVGVDLFSAPGLVLSIGGQVVPVGSLAMTALQSTQAAQAPDYTGWSGFLSGNLGDGERRAQNGNAAFDLKSRGLMAGVDRQFGDSVLGAALHLMQYEADFANGFGSVDTDGYALSLYGTRVGLLVGTAGRLPGPGMHFDGMHLDGSVTFGRHQFESEHDIGLGAIGGGMARGENSANVFAVTAGTGIDAHTGRTDFDLSLQGTWSRADIDDLSEEGSGPLILFVQGHEIESLLANAGLNVRWTFDAPFGLIIPSIRGEMIHEFRGGARLVTARFRRSSVGFTVPVDRPDTNFGKLSVGLQAVFERGLSAFIEVTQDVVRDDLRFRNVQFNVAKSF